MAAVVIRDLVVAYGEIVAVDGVSFSADAGLVTAVLGPNGAGKTSTIETLEGYRRPSSGVVSVLGLDPQRDHRILRRRIGVMLQAGGVYPTMRPLEVLRLFASYYRRPLDPQALLDRVGLVRVARTPWRRLSGGEQQRLSLALALVGRPDVAFLDEPTAGVDPAGRAVIRDVIRELCEDGVAVVLTTHELEEAERVADRVVIMDRGHVVAAGTPADLMAPGTDFRFEGPPGIDVAALGRRLGCQVAEADGGEYRIDHPPTPQILAALTAWLADHDVALANLKARQSLEDVFLRLTGASTAELDRAARRRRGGGGAAA